MTTTSPRSDRPRLTLDDRLDIAARYRAGELVQEIGARYGIAPTTVSRIAHRAGEPPRLRRAGHPASRRKPLGDRAVQERADALDSEAPDDITGWKRVNRGGVVRWVRPERAA